MIGLDTNVLLRFLLQDDARQAAAVNRYLQKPGPFYIDDIVMVETVWVLESALGMEKKAIAELLDQILRVPDFAFSSTESLWAALSLYRAVKGDFSDHLLSLRGVQHGCTHTITFDKALRGAAAFELLDS